MNMMKTLRKMSEAIGSTLSLSMILQLFTPYALYANPGSINLQTQNVSFTEHFLKVPCPETPLKFNLRYQSISPRSAGVLGKNWVHNYEWSLDNPNSNEVKLNTGSGSQFTFSKNTDGSYDSPSSSTWEIEKDGAIFSLDLPGGKQYIFDSSGQLKHIGDAWGNQVTCSYGTNNCLERVQHSNGRSMLFSNTWHGAVSEWRIASVEVPDGATLGFSYGNGGQCTQVVQHVDSENLVSAYQYTGGYLTHRTDRAGFEYSYTYQYGSDGKGVSLSADEGYHSSRVQSINDYKARIYDLGDREQYHLYKYNVDGDLTANYGGGDSVADAQRRGVEYTYFNDDRTKVRQFDLDTGHEYTRHFKYDDAHNITNFMTAYGSTTPVQGDQLQYHPEWNEVTLRLEADGSRTEITYTNGKSQVIKKLNDAGQFYETHLAYTSNGWLTATTNENGNTMKFGYDENGELKELFMSGSPVITFKNNPLGYPIRLELLTVNRESTGRITEFETDDRGHITKTTHPDATTEEFKYNPLGHLVEYKDRAGRIMENEYVLSRTISAFTRYLNQGGSNLPVRISYDLDKKAKLLNITNPKGDTVESYQLDAQDRITSVTNIEGRVEFFTYAVGRFVDTTTRFDGTVVSHTYDNAGRLSAKSYDGDVVNMNYHADGRTNTIADATTSQTYDFNLLNRLVSLTSSIPTLVSTAIYAHDPAGNVTNSVMAFNGQSLVTGYQYDTAERVSVSGENRYVYSPENGLVATLSNVVSGITTSYGYDIMNQVTNIAYRASDGSLIRALNYERNAVGMVTKKTMTGGATNCASSCNYVSSYAYDSLDRLIGETTDAGTVSYAYDLAGNRTTKTAKGLTTSYALGLGNRLASSSVQASTNTIPWYGTTSELIGTDNRWGYLEIKNLELPASPIIPDINGASFHASVPVVNGQTNRIVSAIRDVAGNMSYATNAIFAPAPVVATNAASSYTYDAAGCLTNLNGISLGWDSRYRLTAVTNTDSSVVKYDYNVLNQKISRTANGSTERYVYDGHHIVADLNASNTMVRSYTYGPGIDNIQTMTLYGNNETNTYHYLKDHINTVIGLTDSSGIVVESYDYDAYGNILDVKDSSGISIVHQKSALGNRYTFQGREIDWETGLYNFRARWYDAETGRWLSKDPIGISGGFNQYEAFASNPVNFVDPMGESWLDVFVAVNLVGQAIGSRFGGVGIVAVGIAAAIIATIGTVGDIRENNQSMSGDQTLDEVLDEVYENQDNYDYWYDEGRL